MTATENLLGAWIERNREHQVELHARLVEAALPCDLTAAVQIARWVYRQTEEANGQVWVTEKVLRHLGPDWSQRFRRLKSGRADAVLFRLRPDRRPADGYHIRIPENFLHR